MKDVPIQTKHDLTFEKANDLAMSMEIARSDLNLISGAESDQEYIIYIRNMYITDVVIII